MNRRQFVVGAAVAPICSSSSALARDPIFLGDMHFHLFFMGPRPAALQPLAKTMAAGQASLVSWSLVGDVPWLQPVAGGFKQKGRPTAGEATAWFEAEMTRVKQHLDEQKLAIVLSPDDLDKALGGEPHVVLSIEGAAFLDDDLKHLARAREQGIRHVQLVHFIGNRIGDIQTAPPVHGGLTDFGRSVIRQCNRLGILVDLAHCPDRIVLQALEISTAPMVVSHGSVKSRRGGTIRTAPWQARQIEFATAKALADKGGVIGVWALGADVGATIDSYAARVLELSDRLGADHVAFGTDMNALAKPAVSSYADLRLVVDAMATRSRDPLTIRKIAIENYARVLRASMVAAA